jgi:hypothetical protein
MPDSWNSETYRERARQWQAKADSLPPGDERDASRALAEGYLRLALLIEITQTSRPLPLPNGSERH